MGFKFPTWLRLVAVIALAFVSYGLYALAPTVGDVTVRSLHGSAYVTVNSGPQLYELTAQESEGSWFPPWMSGVVAAIFMIVVGLCLYNALGSNNRRHRYHSTAGGLVCNDFSSWAWLLRRGGRAKARSEQVLSRLILAG